MITYDDVMGLYADFVNAVHRSERIEMKIQEGQEIMPEYRESMRFAVGAMKDQIAHFEFLVRNLDRKINP